MTQQPTDTICTPACATVRDVSRAAEFFVGSEFQLMRLRAKMVGIALDNLSQLEGQLDAAKDQIAPISAQNAYMKLQANQSASTARQWADLLNEARQSCLRQATEWNGQFQHRPGTAVSSAQLLITSLGSWQTLINTFNTIAVSATQARPSSQPQAKSRSMSGV